MKEKSRASVEEAKEAALEVLLHNLEGPFQSLPRTAGWGYPEPYTRDLMISSLGVLVSGNEKLIKSLRQVLETLARNQSRLGHIPSLVHDPGEQGASDTTPLFLIALALFRKLAGEPAFLQEAAEKALRWMEYQSPVDCVAVAQQPTSDWRDEQWVWGYGLYVNTLVYTFLQLYNMHSRASALRETMNYPSGVDGALAICQKPYYALYSYKLYSSSRFDLLGNCLAILSGIASPSKSEEIISWVETECKALRKKKELAIDLPPCLLPYVQPGDPDWHPRYEKYGRPGEYHNGGVWPFICGFYVAAAVAAGQQRLAEKKLLALTQIILPAREANVVYGFNEWFRAQDGTPQGQDWQTWSAAMYLYAAASVERGETPFFDKIRGMQSQA